MISVTKLKRCLDRNATWWMGWILASVAIAWLRLYVLANGVFRYSLQYEEGNVYWKVSRFYPWFRALFTPDFNSIPLFYRLSAHFIYNGLGWHDQYPVAIKFTLFAFFSAGVLLLLHPKFTLVPWSARALLVLCFHFCAGPELVYSFNCSYGAWPAALFLFVLYSRDEVSRRDLYWLGIVPFVCFSKSQIMFLSLPAALLFLLNYRKSRRHFVAWLTLTGAFFLVSVATLSLSRFGKAGVPYLFWHHVPGYLFASGMAATNLLTLTLSPHLLTLPYLARVLCALLIGLGAILHIKAIYLVWSGLREKNSQSALVGSLLFTGPLAFSAVMSLKLYPGYTQWRTFTFSAGELLWRESFYFSSRHFFMILAPTVVLCFYWVTRSRLPQWAKALGGIGFGLLCCVNAQRIGRQYIPAQRNPFLSTVYRELPRLSPELFCFPSWGFPWANVSCGCRLQKAPPQSVVLVGSSLVALTAPPKTVAVAIDGGPLSPSTPLTLDASGRAVREFVDPDLSYFRYFWLGPAAEKSGPTAISLALRTSLKIPVTVKAYFYVQDP